MAKEASAAAARTTACIAPAAASGSMQDMLTEARASERTIIDEMRVAADLAGEQRNPGTADLFTRVVQAHEKHEWFLREALVENDGL